MAALLICAIAMAADDASPGAHPDYSRRALTQFVYENEDLIVEDDGLSVNGSIIEYRRGSWLVRALPIVAPLMLSNAAGANVSPMPYVDPLVLTGVSMPHSSWSWRDRWEERRIRNFLRRNVEDANRQDNE